MKTCRRHKIITLMLACGLAVGLISPLTVQAQDDGPVSNEYRLTLSGQHGIKDDLTGFANFEYRDNPEMGYQAYQAVWPGLTYSIWPWLKLSVGLLTRYTDNEQSADTLELRPFTGVQLFLPNKINWKIYNYTRYEYRDTENLDTDEWSAYGRLRSRFGVVFPLTSFEKAWEPKTWYGLADVEPIYRFDQYTIDPLYLRAGLGYILSDRVRLEFIYWAQFSRSNQGSLQYAENIFQLNIKIGFGKGLLRRLLIDGGG